MELELRRFLDAMKDAYGSALAGAPKSLAASLDRLIDGLQPEPLTVRDLAPQKQPVCRFLPESLKAAAHGPSAPIAAAVGDLLPHLHWIYRYNVEDRLPGFSQNWGHAEVIGPAGLAESRQIRLGLVLLGPETFYPAHHHPAVEVYHILSGTAEWQIGNGPFVPQPPGRFILHPSGAAHATRTAEEPLLAIFAWHGQIETLADWCPGSL